MKLQMSAALGIALAAAMSVSALADGISVRLDAVANDYSQTVDFGEYAPTQINNRTYVHTRGFAEAAGMKITWDGEAQTAFIKVMADENSDKPVEVFAAKQFAAIADRALGTPSDITVSLSLNNSKALLRYNYDVGGVMNGLGKNITMDGAAYMQSNSALMVPLRGIMEALGLTVGWEQESMTAYISVPENAFVPDGLEQTDTWLPEREYYTGNAMPDYIPDGAHEIGEYLGSFRITKYCPCDICNGDWGPYTAWAGEIIPGQTIGVNPDIIPKLAWVYIDGIGWRRAEDTGSGIGTYHIDMAVDNHYEATHNYIGYRDVWIAK